MPYEIQGLDLPRVMLAAQQYRQGQEQERLSQLHRKAIDEELQKKQLADEAQGYIDRGQKGGMEMLRLADPRRFEQVQAANAANEKARQEQESKRIAAAANVERMYQQTPDDKKQDFVQRYRSLGDSVPQIDFENIGKAQIQNIAMGGQLPDNPKGQFAEETVLVANRLGYSDPSMALSDPRYKETLESIAREEIIKRRAGATNISNQVGGSSVGLTGSQQSNQQGEVIGARLQLKQLGAIDRDIAAAGGYGEIEGLANKGEDFVRQKFASIGMTSDEANKAIAARAKVVASVASLRNKVISQLSGAAVSDSEMERLVESLPTVGEPEAVFNAKMEAWKQNLEIIAEHGVDALVSGVRTKQESKPKGVGAKRTDPATGETRTWNGSAWVK